MFELWYWCHQRSEWRRVEGPDYGDIGTAVGIAERATMDARRAIQVRDLYTGEVLHQTQRVENGPLSLHPAYW